MTIPKTVCKKMSGGWTKHIPLTCLIDTYSLKNAIDPKAHHEPLTIDTTSGSVATISKALPTDRESHLPYNE